MDSDSRAQRGSTDEMDSYSRMLDEIDAAARVVDPVLAAANGAAPVHGQFLKDYAQTEW